MNIENPDFLKKKYDLHNTEEVESAARRTEIRTNENIPQKPEAQIQNYLYRFKEIIERDNTHEKERGMEALKKVLHKKFVIESDEIPESYWEGLKNVAHERGQGADFESVDWHTLQDQNTEAIIADQTSSLDNWVDYLSSSDATYPDWLKYYTLKSVLNIGEYNKEKKQFTKRSKGTVKPFPDINREALAYVLDAIEKKQAGVETVVSPNIETEEVDNKLPRPEGLGIHHLSFVC